MNTPKNWIRLSATVAEFRNSYGHFPTSATLGHETVADIKQGLTEQEWNALVRVLPVRITPSTAWRIKVKDRLGNAISYEDVRLSPEGYQDAEIFLGDFFRGCYSIQ
jgi:hypothetical protein